MRTRIALMAAVPVTLIATTAPLALAGAAPGARPTTHPSQLLALRTVGLGTRTEGMESLLRFSIGRSSTAGSFHHARGEATAPGTITLAEMTVPLPTATAITPVAAPAPPPPPPPPVPVTDATSTGTADWDCIRIHESGDRYNSSAAPSGAYGIVQVTWHSFGYSGWPYEASSAVQDAVALRLYNEYGWQPWSTRTVCGL